MAFRTRVPSRALRVALAVLVAGVALLLGSPSAAANSIVDSNPPADTEVTTQPSAIVMTFENPVPEQTDVQVVCEGNPFSGLGAPEPGEDNQLSVALQAPLPAGDCSVTWVLTNDDGTTDRGSFEFAVSEAAAAAQPGAADATTTGTDAAAAATTSSGESDSGVRDAESVSNAPIWLGRVLSIIGVSVLFGSLVLIVAAWPEGPEYVLALRFLRWSWGVGVAGTLIYVTALAAEVKGESFGSGINPSAWFDLFDAGWSGRAAVVRVVLVLACGWVVLKPERVIDPTTNMLALGIPALTVLTLGLSRTGGSLAFLGVLASFAHVLAMAVWFGAAVLLARVVLAGPGEEDLVHAVRGFGRISNPAIIVTVVSGLIQLYRQVGGELFSSGHGRVLLLKTVAVAAMIFVGMTTRQIAHAKLARSSELSVRVADRMRRAFGTEAAIGLVVIALTGWMLALDPGKIPDDDTGDFAIAEPFTDQELNFEVEVRLRPGRIGLNELEVIVRQPEAGLSGLEIRFHPPQGSNVSTIIQPIALTGAGVARSDQGIIPLAAAGTWRIEVAASAPGITGISANVRIADEQGNVPDPPQLSVPDLPARPTTTSTVAESETTES
ncbi:MAG: copper resistance CopC/CopD family protein [Acidimicrobiales bacterium]